VRLKETNELAGETIKGYLSGACFSAAFNGCFAEIISILEKM
jgi:hypothetical protein